MTLIKDNYYKICFQGYFIQDCSIINSNSFIFSCRNIKDSSIYDPEDEYNIHKKISWCKIKNDYNIIGGSRVLNNFARIYTSALPDEGIFVDGDGAVYVLDGHGSHQEQNVQYAWPQEYKNIAIFKLKKIHNTIYGCGAKGLAFRRTGKNQWEYLGSPMEATNSDNLNNSFLDIDGFSPEDMYAIGGYGCVWHYDGITWKPTTFPSNIPLESICCAGDGNVYICGQSGTIFKGYKNKWKMVHKGSSTLPYIDMVWFNNTLWCTHDYGLWNIRDGLFSKADVSRDVLQCSGHLSATKDTLLVGGIGGAAWYNGTEWKILYHAPVEDF